MQCPKCHSPMEDVILDGTEVDRCISCKGLWFGMLKDEKLLSTATTIDTGDRKVGAQYNAIDRIDCPVCPNTPMRRMVDNRQSHIWFESCPSCYGRFFDAGEFRDLAKHSLSDLIRDLFKGERK
jgi:Zn-finger nucleic acid-binding protein